MSGNTIIYSDYRPFIGAGEEMLSWSITQRLVKSAIKAPTEAGREFTEPPFTAWQLCNYVRRYIAELSWDPLPERHLPNLTVRDRIFVAGTEVLGLDVDTPREAMWKVITYPTAPARHYLEC